MLFNINRPMVRGSFAKPSVNQEISQKHLEELIQLCQETVGNANIANRFNVHLGPTSTFTQKKQIREFLQGIYSYLQTLNASQNDIKNNIVYKITERAENCTAGFYTGVVELYNDIYNTPQSFNDYLALMRQDILGAFAASETTDVHHRNSIFEMASSSRYQTMNINSDDPYLMPIGPNGLQATLDHFFDRRYQFFPIIKDILGRFLSLLISQGYSKGQNFGEHIATLNRSIAKIFSSHPVCKKFLSCEQALASQSQTTQTRKDAINTLVDNLFEKYPIMLGQPTVEELKLRVDALMKYPDESRLSQAQKNYVALLNQEQIDELNGLIKNEGNLRHFINSNKIYGINISRRKEAFAGNTRSQKLVPYDTLFQQLTPWVQQDLSELIDSWKASSQAESDLKGQWSEQNDELMSEFWDLSDWSIQEDKLTELIIKELNAHQYTSLSEEFIKNISQMDSKTLSIEEKLERLELVLHQLLPKEQGQFLEYLKPEVLSKFLDRLLDNHPALLLDLLKENPELWNHLMRNYPFQVFEDFADKLQAMGIDIKKDDRRMNQYFRIHFRKEDINQWLEPKSGFGNQSSIRMALLKRVIELETSDLTEEFCAIIPNWLDEAIQNDKITDEQFFRILLKIKHTSQYNELFLNYLQQKPERIFNLKRHAGTIPGYEGLIDNALFEKLCEIYTSKLRKISDYNWHVNVSWSYDYHRQNFTRIRGSKPIEQEMSEERGNLRIIGHIIAWHCNHLDRLNMLFKYEVFPNQDACYEIYQGFKAAQDINAQIKIMYEILVIPNRKECLNEAKVHERALLDEILNPAFDMSRLSQETVNIFMKNIDDERLFEYCDNNSEKINKLIDFMERGEFKYSLYQRFHQHIDINKQIKILGRLENKTYLRELLSPFIEQLESLTEESVKILARDFHVDEFITNSLSDFELKEPFKSSKHADYLLVELFYVKSFVMRQVNNEQYSIICDKLIRAHKKITDDDVLLQKCHSLEKFQILLDKGFVLGQEKMRMIQSALKNNGVTQEEINAQIINHINNLQVKPNVQSFFEVMNRRKYTTGVSERLSIDFINLARLGQLLESSDESTRDEILSNTATLVSELVTYIERNYHCSQYILLNILLGLFSLILLPLHYMNNPNQDYFYGSQHQLIQDIVDFQNAIQQQPSLRDEILSNTATLVSELVTFVERNYHCNHFILLNLLLGLFSLILLPLHYMNNPNQDNFYGSQHQLIEDIVDFENEIQGQPSLNS